MLEKDVKEIRKEIEKIKKSLDEVEKRLNNITKIKLGDEIYSGPVSEAPPLPALSSGSCLCPSPREQIHARW